MQRTVGLSLRVELRSYFGCDGMGGAFHSIAVACREFRGKQKLIQSRTVYDCSL